ncbi:MAG: AAA family ATPase [Candidatus Izimaplasma sp.]|nr:AAA family ATPase [Candidatus Izimaplasma bacterium]
MIFEQIDQHIKANKKCVIAIDGPSASGKSTLANRLKDTYECLMFHTDDYFLPDEKKIKSRLQEIGGNLDYERMKEEIFNALDNTFIQSNSFNCKTQKLIKKTKQKNSNIIFVEGVYSMHPEFIEFYTLTIFIDIDQETQKERIKLRNSKDISKRYFQEWIPLENTYFIRYNIRNKSDIYIKNLS